MVSRVCASHLDLVNTIETKLVCFFIRLSRYVNYDEKTNPIHFRGLKSKVKVSIDIYGNKLVNTIETKPLCASSSNLADMSTMVRG